MSKKNSDFKPFIPAEKIVPEFTATSIVIGVILAVLFGGANAYLGLRVGMTVSASIPAAVISMGVIRKILRRDSILENNLVQTIGSAGESVAAGAIFTLPALFLWAKEGVISMPSVGTLGLVALVGGVLGVIFMVPLRQALIVEEHGVLPFPEGTACAEVLLAGEEGGSKAGVVFSGLGLAALYKLVSDGLKIFPSEIGHDIAFYKGSSIGIQVLPALAGVGYICGPKISSFMFAGGTLSWFVIMPLIALFGGDAVVFPGTDPISTLAPSALWSTYVKYIGAGAVATGGIISLIKSFPLIVRTFKQAMQGMKSAGKASMLRTEQDIPMPVLLVAMVVGFNPRWSFFRMSPRWSGRDDKAEGGAADSTSTADDIIALLAHQAEEMSATYGLSNRETEVAELLLAGRSRPYIRDELIISLNTVHAHARNIYAKCGVHSQQEFMDLLRPAGKREGTEG